MAKRFNETVNIRQVDTRTGAPQAAASLADRLSRFSNATSAVASKEATKFATDEGAKAGEGVELRGEEGKLQSPKFKESRIIGGVAIDSHNKALRARYMSEQNNDIREAVSAAAANNPNNILGFNDSIEGYKKGLFANLEPTVRAEVETDFNNMVSSARVKVQGGTIRQQRQENIEGLSTSLEKSFESAASATRSNNNTEAGESFLQGVIATDAMVDAGYITAAKGQQIKDRANQEMAEQSFRLELDNITENEGYQAAFAKLDEMDGNPPKGFSPDQWDTFIASAQADVNQARVREAQQQAQMTSAQEREVSNLKIQAKTGTGDASEIVTQTEAFFDAGLLSGNERTSIFTSLINGQKKHLKTAADMSAVAQRMAGNNAVVVDSKASDKYYEDFVAPTFDGMTPQEVDEQKVNYVDRMKRVPKALKDEVSTFVASGDPVLVRQGLELMDKIDSVPGVIEDTFSTHQRAFAQTVIDLSANMEPAEAVALATENTDPTNKARIEAVELEIKESKKGFRAIDYRDLVDDHFDPIFGSTRVGDISGDQLAKEYEQSYEELLKSGMNKDSASEKAFQLIDRNWKESGVTGRVMKYRPDDSYAVNGQVDYIRDQLATEVNAIGGFAEPVPKENIFIQATEATARSAAGGLPAYRIVIVDDSGNMAPFYGQDGDGLWFPDMQKEMTRIEAENKKAGEAAVTHKDVRSKFLESVGF